MRVRITFWDRKLVSYLPINTNYYLSKLLDKIIKKHQEYLQSLIPQRCNNGGTFDTYTFSQLIIPSRRIEHKRIAVYSPDLYWYISSPYHQFISILAREFRLRKQVKIAGNSYSVSKFQFIKPPVFSSGIHKFTCLSPITVTRNNNSNLGGKLSLGNYLMPDSAEFETRLLAETHTKLNLLTNNQINNIEFSLEFDKKYLKRKNNKISKLIAIEKNKEKPHYIRAVFAPLRISTTPDILTIIYDAGLGSYNALGFGMIRKINTKKPGSS
jgi:CRISPR-associated endoribonuclease Cas6